MQQTDSRSPVAEAPHPLEHNEGERIWFFKVQRTATVTASAYRRAVEAVTGSLPTWAERTKAGRKFAMPAEQRQTARELISAGVPVATLARQFNTSRATISRIRDSIGPRQVLEQMRAQ